MERLHTLPMHTPAPNAFLLAVLCFGIGAMAIWNFRYRTMPVPLFAVIVIAGFVHAVSAGGPRGAVASLFGTAVAILLLLWPFSRRFVGRGDVSLLSAVGVWVGVAGTVRILLLGTAAGGLLALAFLVRLPRKDRAQVRRNLATFVRSGELVVPEHLDRTRAIPYGIALTVAAFWVLLYEAR